MSEVFAALIVELRLGLTLLEPDASTHWLDENKQLLRYLEGGELSVAEDALVDYLAQSERDLLGRL